MRSIKPLYQDETGYEKDYRAHASPAAGRFSREAVHRVMRLFQKMFVVDQRELGLLEYEEGPPPVKMQPPSLPRRVASAAIRRARRLQGRLLQAH